MLPVRRNKRLGTRAHLTCAGCKVDTPWITWQVCMTLTHPAKPFLYELGLVVRMYDIDFNGHVNNIVYVRWLEDMRMVSFEKIVPMKSVLDQGQIPVLIRTDIRYKRPIKMFDEPKGAMWLNSFSKSSFTIDAEITVNNEVNAYAVQTIVFVNNSGKLIRLPEPVVERFRAENVLHKQSGRE